MRILTPEEAAEILRLSTRTVYNYLREGKIPGRKVGGGRWRILESDLEDYMRGEQRKEPGQEEVTA